jgi:hypothetical protein
MTSPPSFAAIRRDPRLLGPSFRGDTWRAWDTAMAAVMGEPIPDEDLPLLEQLTGLTEAPTTRAKEAHLICGRRSGKSLNTAALAVFLAAFIDWRPHLAPGELGVVLIFCPDRRQAQIVLRYILAMLTECKMLKGLVKRSDRESIELFCNIEIRIATVSLRTARGFTIVAALLDELAYWRSDESANPDKDVIDAILPGLATTPGSMLIGLSSPYRQSGFLYDRCKNYFGKPGPIRIIRGSTPLMNPTIDQRIIDEAMERDEAVARSEWLGEFRSDLANAIDPDQVDAATREDDRDLPRQPNTTYRGFADTSGGRHDAYTFAVAHRDSDGRQIIDAVRERRPPFDPSAVTAEYATLAKSYGIGRVVGDNYSGQWVATEFEKNGVAYEPSPLSKSKIYLEVLVLFNIGTIEIPNNRRLISELKSLERRVRPGGRDVIDHPQGGRDDVANSVAGAAVLVAGTRAPPNFDDAFFVPFDRNIFGDTPTQIPNLNLNLEGF